MQHRSSPALLKSALFIINPVSGKKQILPHLPQIIRRLMDAGYLVTTAVTAERGEATDFASRYGGVYDLICCSGGDGTLNETLSGLARAGHHVPLGYIPCGSTNDFALSRSLSLDIDEAAENIASGSCRYFDVGCFGSHYFSYVAAFGAFSWLSYTTDQNLKNLLGHAAYILDGIRDLSKIKPYHVRLTADGKLHEGDFLFGAICNTTSIAGTLELPAQTVDAGDGLFEVLLVHAPKTLPEYEPVIRGLLTQDYSSPLIEFFQAEELHVVNPPDMDWSLDGEFPGHYDEVDVSVLPRFLELRG